MHIHVRYVLVCRHGDTSKHDEVDTGYHAFASIAGSIFRGVKRSSCVPVMGMSALHCGYELVWTEAQLLWQEIRQKDISLSHAHRLSGLLEPHAFWVTTVMFLDAWR